MIAKPFNMQVKAVFPIVIAGGQHLDSRGEITFVNDFDMSTVCRFYRIRHTDIDIIRAWRGHKIEQRWFHVLQGEFNIKLICIDDWNNPDPKLEPTTYTLTAHKSEVLHVPSGYASWLKATEPSSEIIVFADHSIAYQDDNYTFPPDYFVNGR